MLLVELLRTSASLAIEGLNLLLLDGNDGPLVTFPSDSLLSELGDIAGLTFHCWGAFAGSLVPSSFTVNPLKGLGPIASGGSSSSSDSFLQQERIAPIVNFVIRLLVVLKME